MKSRDIDFSKEPGACRCPKCGKFGKRKLMYVGKYQDILKESFDHKGYIDSVGGFTFISIQEHCAVDVTPDIKIVWEITYLNKKGERKKTELTMPISLSDVHRNGMGYWLHRNKGIKDVKKIVKWRPKEGENFAFKTYFNQHPSISSASSK